jgi:hypothetical protein
MKYVAYGDTAKDTVHSLDELRDEGINSLKNGEIRE